jgi:TGF-beta propeptide
MIRKFQLRTLSTLCLLILFAALTSQAQITPSQDAYTNSAAPTTNYGAKTLLDVDGATQITYIQFNLSSIPADASVSQATLKLYVNAVSTAGSFNVDYVNGTWSEGAITYDMAPALGAAIASNVSITTADKNQYILINITPAVQTWLSGAGNDGIALVANNSFNVSFDSKENTKTSHPPELDIAYAGGDGTITGVTTASGSGLMGDGTSGTLSLSLTSACTAN